MQNSQLSLQPTSDIVPFTMNWFTLSLLGNFLLFSILSVPLISSASFPQAPHRPPANASADEKALFWKLLHNYYAIIARPRFGKRSDSAIFRIKHPSAYDAIGQDSLALSSSESDLNSIFDENRFNVRGPRIRIGGDRFVLETPDRRRRRRR